MYNIYVWEKYANIHQFNEELFTKAAVHTSRPYVVFVMLTTTLICWFNIQMPSQKQY